MPIELVIFDCDGVLVDSEVLANRVLAALLTDVGLPTTTEESLATYMGLSTSSWTALAAEKLGRPLPDDFVGFAGLLSPADCAFDPAPASPDFDSPDFFSPPASGALPSFAALFRCAFFP